MIFLDRLIEKRRVPLHIQMKKKMALSLFPVLDKRGLVFARRFGVTYR